ncbi:MAG: C-type lectin domain-containing protein [Kofleriaceae bacterium]|jgi:hypothetical protein|nr:C-type lectin domain-containing protein [Kofleriaceae bacterium]
MRRALVLPIALAAGCFAPSSHDLPCSLGQLCPVGQVCGVADGRQVCVAGGEDAAAGDDATRAVDASGATVDAGTADGALVACPTGYLELGVGLPLVRMSTTGRSFDAAASDCADDAPGRTYLIAFRSQAELDAYRLTSTQEAWVGVRYDAVTATFLSLDGTAVTFLPWEGSETGMDPGRCPLVRPSAGTYVTRSCSLNRPYACECR